MPDDVVTRARLRAGAPSPPEPPAWAQRLGALGEGFSKALMALDPLQSIPYIISQQPKPKAWLDQHPKMADAINGLTQLGMNFAGVHAGVPAKMSDEDAWGLALQHQPDIEAMVNAGVRRGAIHPNDREDAISNAQLQAVDLAKRFDPSVGDFASYLRSSLSRGFQSNIGTDALDRPYRTDIETPSGEVTPQVSAVASETPSEVPTPATDPDAPATLPEQFAAIQDHINSIHVKGDQHRTEKLQRVATKYLLRGQSMDSIAAQHHIAKGTIQKLVTGAPAKINIAEAIQQVQSPEALQAKIDTMPASLHALATKLLLDTKPPTKVMRETGRNEQPDRDYLMRQFSQVLNALK